MNVTRSVVYGVVGPCKTESSQKPVLMHPTLADALTQWRKRCTYIKPEDWFLQASAIGAEGRTGDRRSCANTANTYVPRYNEPEFRSDSDGIRFGTLDPAAKRGD
jgi:hypothetical protein